MRDPTTYRTIAVPTADGFTLGGRLYGDLAAARAGVLIAPAMAVPQDYYADFATWLARQGYAVLGFDYRGIGASCLGAVVTVASGSGYWRENARRLRRSVWALWYLIAPLAVTLAGYFPGRRLRKVGDLPAGVMTQWRRWCLSPDFMMGEGGAPLRARYAQVRNPILSLSFTDDEFMSERNIESLHAFYAGAAREMRRIAPQEIGVPAIGHFGFFRSRFAGSLWPQVAQFLAAA